MENNILRYLEDRENKRVQRVANLAKNLNVTFEDAEKIVEDLSQGSMHPKEVHVFQIEIKPKKAKNIVSVDDVSEKIVSRAIRELNLYFQVDIDEFKSLVKEEIKAALKKVKVIDVVETREENERLKREHVELRKDIGRLKSALEGTICGMVTYADSKGNAEIESRLDSYRKKAGEALRLSDLHDAQANKERPNDIIIAAINVGR